MFESLPGIIKVCSDREAVNFGIFLLSMLAELERWRADEKVRSPPQ